MPASTSDEVSVSGEYDGGGEWTATLDGNGRWTGGDEMFVALLNALFRPAFYPLSPMGGRRAAALAVARKFGGQVSFAGDEPEKGRVY